MFERTMLTAGSRRWFRPPVTRLAINDASRKLQTDCAFSSICGSNFPRARRWTRDRRVGSPTSVDAGAGRDGAQPSTLSCGIGRSLAACLRLIDRDSRLRSSIGRVTAAHFHVPSSTPSGKSTPPIANRKCSSAECCWRSSTGQRIRQRCLLSDDRPAAYVDAPKPCQD